MKKFLISIVLLIVLFLGYAYTIPKRTFTKSRNEMIDEVAEELNIPKGLAKFAIGTDLGNRIVYSLIKKKVKKKFNPKESKEESSTKKQKIKEDD